MHPQQQQSNLPVDPRLRGADKKISAGLCALFLGTFGVHKFILGYSREGTIMLMMALGSIILGGITCGFLLPVVLIPATIALIEGILYLTKSDEEFVQTYIEGKKGWF